MAQSSSTFGTSHDDMPVLQRATAFATTVVLPREDKQNPAPPPTVAQRKRTSAHEAGSTPKQKSPQEHNGDSVMLQFREEQSRLKKSMDGLNALMMRSISTYSNNEAKIEFHQRLMDLENKLKASCIIFKKKDDEMKKILKENHKLREDLGEANNKIRTFQAEAAIHEQSMEQMQYWKTMNQALEERLKNETENASHSEIRAKKAEDLVTLLTAMKEAQNTSTSTISNGQSETDTLLMSLIMSVHKTNNRVLSNALDLLLHLHPSVLTEQEFKCELQKMTGNIATQSEGATNSQIETVLGQDSVQKTLPMKAKEQALYSKILRKMTQENMG